MKIIVDQGDGYEHAYEVADHPRKGKVLLYVSRRRSTHAGEPDAGTVTTAHELSALEALAIGNALVAVARWVVEPAFVINQELRVADPSRVANQFLRDLEKAAKNNPPRDPTGRGFDP